MSSTSNNQVDQVLQETSQQDSSKNIALIELNKEATPAETEIFLRFLTNITKRILVEASEKQIEPKAS